MSNDRKKLKICILSIALMTLFLFSSLTSVAASSSWTANRPTQTTSYNSQTVSNCNQDGNGAVSVSAQIVNYTHDDAAYEGNDVVRLDLAAMGNGRESLQYVIQSGTGYDPEIRNPSNPSQPMWIQTSTPTNITSDDSGTWINLNQGFWFYGLQYWSVWVSSNGFISFTDNSTSPVPKALNSSEPPNTVIAPFWTDLTPGADGNITYYMDSLYNYQFGNWVFCVTWMVHDLNCGNAWQVFQIILQQNPDSANEGQMDYIYINYQTITVHSGVMIGVENQDGTKATSWDVNAITSQSYLQMICPESALGIAGMSVKLEKNQYDTYSAFCIPVAPDGTNECIVQNLDGLTPHLEENWDGAMFAFILCQLGDWLLGECTSAIQDATISTIGSEHLSQASDFYGAVSQYYSDAQQEASANGIQLPNLPQIPSLSLEDYINWSSFYYLDPGSLSGFGNIYSQTASMSPSYQLTDYSCRYDTMISSAIDWVLHDANCMPHSITIAVSLTYYTGVGTNTQTVNTSVQLSLNNTGQPDSTWPEFTSTPNNPTYYVVGSATGSLQWIALDDDPDIYTISMNGALVSGPCSWAFDPIIQYQLPTSVLQTVGTYVYNCTIRDKSGHYTSSIIDVIVTYPEITFTSPTSGVLYNTPSPTLNVNFTLCVNAVSLNTNSPPTVVEVYEYQTGSAGPSDATFLSNSGEDYYYSATLNLGGGQHAIMAELYNNGAPSIGSYSAVVVNVQYIPPPTIDTPSSLTYSLGSTGHTITWHPVSSSPQKYWILDYDLLTRPPVLPGYQGTWGGGAITLPVDGLAVGSHTFECDVWDTYGRMAGSEVTVTVVPAPVFATVPGPITYEYGTTGHTLTWQVVDQTASAYPGTYTIYMWPTSGYGAGQPSLWQSGKWSNNTSITTSVNGLSAVGWVFECVVTDTYGVSASSEVTVTVQYAAPTFTSTQGNINANPGKSFTLSWTATDGAPTTYSITCNGATVVSGQSWKSGTAITYTWSQSSTGSYTYTITVSDASGSSYTSSSSAIVTVTLFTSTQSSFGDNLGYPFTLSWTAVASSPSTYTITCNGAQVASGNWKSGVAITYTTTPTKVGTYTYTITVNSSQGSSTVSCTVTVKALKVQ